MDVYVSPGTLTIVGRRGHPRPSSPSTSDRKGDRWISPLCTVHKSTPFHHPKNISRQRQRLRVCRCPRTVYIGKNIGVSLIMKKHPAKDRSRSRDRRSTPAQQQPPSPTGGSASPLCLSPGSTFTQIMDLSPEHRAEILGSPRPVRGIVARTPFRGVPPTFFPRSPPVVPQNNYPGSSGSPGSSSDSPHHSPDLQSRYREEEDSLYVPPPPRREELAGAEAEEAARRLAQAAVP